MMNAVIFSTILIPNARETLHLDKDQFNLMGLWFCASELSAKLLCLVCILTSMSLPSNSHFTCLYSKSLYF